MRNDSFIYRWGMGLLLFSLGFSPEVLAQWQPQFSGQLNIWGTLEEDSPQLGRNGIRYLPSLKGGSSLNGEWETDYEATANLYKTVGKEGDGEKIIEKQDLKAHRLWARVFTDQLEVRLGLQKINFGPGKTLRALQWFDQIDPNDPTQFTEGVKGVLVRYYFPQEFNLWTWLLYGNEEITGISPYETSEETAEWGGRVQSRAFDGEMAVSFHHRKIDPTPFPGPRFPGMETPHTENRLGLDGQWDLGAGLWFEATWIEFEANPFLPQQQRIAMLGVDYTFDIGNGLYAALEGMHLETISNHNALLEQNRSILALTQTYPLNLLDQLQGIVLWESEPETTTLTAQWQRIYDELIFYITLGIKESSNPPSSTEPPLATQTSDRSVQLLVQYNH